MSLLADGLMVACEQILTAVETHYVGSLPERRYVAAGAPPLDCELVAVWPASVQPHQGDVLVGGGSALERHPGHVLRVATVNVGVYRCVPVPDGNSETLVLPDLADEEAASTLILSDAVAVENAVRAGRRSGELPSCSQVAWQQWLLVEPQGGMGGGVTTFAFGLGG